MGSLDGGSPRQEAGALLVILDCYMSFLILSTFTTMLNEIGEKHIFKTDLQLNIVYSSLGKGHP